MAEQSGVFLPLALLSPCLTFLNLTFLYKMVWWAVKVAGALVGGNHGREMSVFLSKLEFLGPEIGSFSTLPFC